MIVSFEDGLTLRARRRRLVEAILKLADGMVAGVNTPTDDELREVARICDDYQLPIEAARVRRWIGET